MLYDYKCEECGLEFEEFNDVENRVVALCRRCGKEAKHVIKKANKARLFPEGYWHNVGHKPIYVKSASQLAEECKKRWTPWNKPWPEYLDGVSCPGPPNDIKREGCEGFPSKEELCRRRAERLKIRVEKAKELQMKK